jgi:pimeloyl-ACP methyl ester carboxylesterase
MVRSKEPNGKFLQAGEVNVYYHEAGSGYPLICLHGGGPGASGWSNFQSNFHDLSTHHRTILMDLPQYGKSDKPTIKNNWLAFCAGVLRNFMDSLGIQKAHFIGNSMGGQAAIKLAIDNPDRIDHLVVIGSTPVKTTVFQPMPLEAIKNIVTYYEGEGPSPAKMRQLLGSLVYSSSFVTEELVQERFEASNGPDVVRLFKNYFPPLEDLYFELDRVRAKTLIVWGQDDRAGAIDVGLLMLRRFQDARMIIFSKCGHWAQVEHAAEFNRVVLDFLKA